MPDKLVFRAPILSIVAVALAWFVSVILCARLFPVHAQTPASPTGLIHKHAPLLPCGVLAPGQECVVFEADTIFDAAGAWFDNPKGRLRVYLNGKQGADDSPQYDHDLGWTFSNLTWFVPQYESGFSPGRFAIIYQPHNTAYAHARVTVYNGSNQPLMVEEGFVEYWDPF